MTKLGSRLALIALLAGTIGCDRVTKHFAASTLAGTAGHSFLAGTLRLEYAENAGGFLSVGANLSPAARTTVFTVVPALILLGTVVAAVRFHWSGRPLVGAALLFAGGASNLLDRLAHGSVIDFMNVGVGPLRTGIFNVADVAAMVGVGLLALAHYHSDGSTT